MQQHSPTIPVEDQELLLTFPRPPPGPPSPYRNMPNSPGPIRAADFGFIAVALSRDDASDSLYDYPEEPYYGNERPSTEPDSTMTSGEFQLVLDHPSRIFAPRDVISGYILGWDPSFPHLTIILEGLIETALYRDKLHYHDRTPLLRHVTHLKHRQNGQVQQFAITIPERVQEGLSLLNRYSHSNNWTHDWSLQPPFEHTPNHPLPPSITVPRLTSTKLATSYSKASYKITYTLTAVLSPNSSSPLASSPPSQPPQQTTQLPLTLTTLRLPQSKLTLLKQALNTLSTPLSVQTTQLLKPKRLSLLEQLRDSFPTTSTPTFHFRATLSLPTLATPGAPLPLAIRVAVLPPPPGSHAYTFAIPDITVTRVDVRVRAYTGIRSSSPTTSPPSQSSPPSKYPPQKDGQLPSTTFHKTVLRTSHALPATARFCPKEGDFEGQQCVVKHVILPKEEATPGFKTWNVWRGYRVRCKVGFRVVGKDVGTVWEGDLNVVEDEEETEGG